jgi:hypothetical protein
MANEEDKLFAKNEKNCGVPFSEPHHLIIYLGGVPKSAQAYPTK